MIASKIKDENQYRLINSIDTIILNNNLKVEDRDDLYNKCLEFYDKNKHILNNNDFNLDIEGFNFKSEAEIVFNQKLEEYILEILNEEEI